MNYKLRNPSTLKPPPALRARAMGRYLFPPPVSDARALRPGDGFHIEAEEREDEGQILAMLGISNRRFQISDLRFEICNLRSRRAWPRPENLRPEDSASGES